VSMGFMAWPLVIMPSTILDPGLLLTNEKLAPLVGSYIAESLKKCDAVKIASGYVGIKAFEECLPYFRSIASKGGQVTLIFGLGYWEGISPRLEQLLREFHEVAKQTNTASGVFFCQEDKFHGKIYIFEKSRKQWATIGSSNFSSSGFGGWLEANAKLTQENYIDELDLFVARMLESNAKPINLLTFPSRQNEINQMTPRESIAVPNNIVIRPVAFRLQIKPMPKSHLNLFAGKGRRNLNGIYILRPWYEVEIGISVAEMHALRRFVPAQQEPFRVNIVDTTGKVIPANFKRKTSVAGSRATLHQVGVDFMSDKREELGRVIKDKLVDAGVLKYGELITDDILDMYGNRHIEFRQLPGRKNYFWISFEPR